ncbi:MAG: GNAT family N-acetyltransferase [Lachnospiraceae bacterium]|nr:GNAT family N-acetyltransferase [Lachnospiraceae bacterium]
MNNHIILRKIDKKDYDDLAGIISATWRYEEFCTAKTAHKMGRLYLASCLCQQTFHMVAVRENQVVGIIMGNNNRTSQTPFRNKWFLLKCSVAMMLSSEGRKVMKMFRGFDSIDQNLLKESKKNFDGTLCFFVVKGSERGTGVGNKLYEALMAYFNAEKIKNFYLFTDTTCNFGFYEHQGVKRIGEKTVHFQAYGGKTITLFLYEKEIEEVSGG